MDLNSFSNDIDRLLDSLRSVRKLHAKSDNLERRMEIIEECGDRLMEELEDKTPEKNCSCWTGCAPCHDCTTHESSRLAIKEWKESVKCYGRNRKLNTGSI